MKYRFFILVLFLMSALLIPGEAGAFWWPFKHKKTEAPKPIPTPIYSVASLSYRHHYGDAVNALDSINEFVICESCPASSVLERQPNPVPIAIRFTEPLSPSSPAAVAVTPGTVPPGTPGFSSLSGSVSSFTGTTPTATDQPVQTPGAQERGPLASDNYSAESLTSFQSSTPVEPYKEPICHDLTVYFDIGSSSIRSADRIALESFARTNFDRLGVLVKGYTCDIGSKSFNDRLAIARAKSVSLVLESGHLKPLMVSGEGKCCYASQEKELNRRVEILCPKEVTR